MNYAHVHIVINHVPSLGTLVGVGLLILSLIKNNDSLKKISLQILVAMALMVLPTYVTGGSAQHILQTRAQATHSVSDVTNGLIAAHQNSAILTLILITITGTFAWFGLWQFRRFSRPGSGNIFAVLIFSILSAGFILRTANMGGDISHPEIRDSAAAPLSTSGWQDAVASFTNDHSWVWPTMETIHYIGMCLLFGVALIVTVRMLGMMKGIPFNALHRLLPMGILGFVLNVISGMVFFLSDPPLYIKNPAFAAKIALTVFT